MTIRTVEADSVHRILHNGLLIDLRPVASWLERHVRASISVLYEPGPGFGTRARDLLPLDAHLILLEDESSPIEDAASRLRGKGFDVVGVFSGGIDAWPDRSELATAKVVALDSADKPSILLHVGDPGTNYTGDARSIPTERLWEKSLDASPAEPIGVLAGFGVRAAAAVGILEKLGFTNVMLVRTRPESDRPVTAGADSFRIGGPG